MSKCSQCSFPCSSKRFQERNCFPLTGRLVLISTSIIWFWFPRPLLHHYQMTLPSDTSLADHFDLPTQCFCTNKAAGWPTVKKSSQTHANTALFWDRNTLTFIKENQLIVCYQKQAVLPTSEQEGLISRGFMPQIPCTAPFIITVLALCRSPQHSPSSHVHHRIPPSPPSPWGLTTS